VAYEYKKHAANSFGVHLSCTGIDMSENDNFPYELHASSPKSMNFLYFNDVAVQYVWSGADANDSEITMQVSNDRTNWENVAVATVLNAASGNGIISAGDIRERYFRINYSKESVTAGTLALHIVGKRGS
jgi:hypothetical protein